MSDEDARALTAFLMTQKDSGKQEAKKMTRRLLMLCVVSHHCRKRRMRQEIAGNGLL